MGWKLVSAAAAALALAFATGAAAQPMKMPVPEHDYHAAPAGKYQVDPKHTGLIVRVPHIGFSYSVFRFTDVAGTLTWDPANPAADKLEATVAAKSIETAPIPNFDFPGELTNPQFLNAAKFPQMTFVSTAFHPASATHGTVDGDLTVMGVTRHVTFDVDLVGDGKGFKGPVIGVTAKTTLDPKGLGLPPLLSLPIEIEIDTEFDG